MHLAKSLSSTVTLIALASSGKAATVLSQNFDTDPVNFTGSAFAVQASDGSRHYAPSNTEAILVNPGITGNATTFVAVQNIDGDGDGTLTFTTGTPAFMNFDVNVTGYSDLRLSINLAGMPSIEIENYVRALVDVDGDTFYETTVFNFTGVAGTSNLAYTDATLGALSGNFATFADIVLPTTTAVDGLLHFRLEVFNDTQSLNEASGFDDILITGNFVPEPGSLLLAGLAGLGLLRRRR